MEEERPQRRPRYKRTLSDDLGLRLQDRDREMLTLVHGYRFLTSQQIQRLVAGSDQVLLRRLQKLFHAGYLDRLKTSNNDAILYALGNKGADELALLGEIPNRGTIDWTSKNREAKERYLAHTTMIATFRVTLILALRQRPGMQIVQWVPEGELKEEVVVGEGGPQSHRSPLIPDGFFTLEDAGEEMYFFVEADRSTMTAARFLGKMRAYWSWWRQKKHQEKFGIESFRVLTVTKTEARKENLRKITREADDRKTGALLFWFASEERYGPDDPASILRSIWQTPKDDVWHHLLE